MMYSVIIGKILEGHFEHDEEKVKSYAELLAQHYDDDGETRAARIIRSKLDGSYKNMPKITPDPLEIPHAIEK